jgi:uncharacterized membrane protein YhaH (DUF805 family)
MDNGTYSTGASALVGGSLLFTLIIAVASIVFAIIVWWRIFSKAGYSGALSLLLFIPIANLIVICMLAFAEWPILRELNQLRQMAAQRPQYPNTQYQNPNPQYPYPNPQGPRY